MTRFWGTVLAVRARLTLAKFEGETQASSDGHYLVVEGTRTVGAEAPVPGIFVVAIGPATQEEKHVGPGDLVRGNGQPVPEANPDTFADLYRVRTLHLLAHATDRGIARLADPPRTDAPLTPATAPLAPRRVLRSANLEPGGVCAICPYGTVVAIVQLSDPRDYRRGSWSQAPACLGPSDCPHYAAR